MILAFVRRLMKKARAHHCGRAFKLESYKKIKFSICLYSFFVLITPYYIYNICHFLCTIAWI